MKNAIAEPSVQGFFSMLNRYRRAALLCLLGVIITACSQQQEPVQSVTVGWIGPLSGPVSLLGVDNLNAVKLALADYHKEKSANEPDIHLVAVDDQYVSSRSVEAYRKLVAEHQPEVVFLSTYTAMFLIADEALRDGVVLVNPIDNDHSLSQLNKNTFMVAKKTEDLAEVISRAIIKNAHNKILILHFNGDDFMMTVSGLVNEQLKRAEKETLLHEYPRGQEDFSASMQAGLNEQADALVLLGYRELGHAMNQARSLGITAPFYTANVMMRDIAPQAINGTEFFDFTALDGNVLKAKTLLKQYRDHYGTDPTLQWTLFQAFDAANIVIGAIRHPRDIRKSTASELVDHLFQVDNYEGVSGNISINTDGSSEGIEPGLYRLKDSVVSRVE